MKKVIERMNITVIEAQKRELGLPADDKKKKGLAANVFKKVTGGGKKEEDENQPEGLRVDQ
jgi:hypothetical protein